MKRGLPHQFSRTWSWRYLCMKGYVARRRQCKRPIAPEILVKMMQRWLHCCRSTIFLSKSIVDHPDYGEGMAAWQPSYELPKTASAKKDLCFRTKKSIATRTHRVVKADYGYFQLRQRFHTDQAPMDLDNSSIKTYVPQEGSDQPLVSGQPSGDKRFCTLQVSMHADGDAPQPKIGIWMTKSVCFF